MFRLPIRLQAIANLIDDCNLIADIGTDHGLLAIYLCMTDKTKKAIASDIAVKPLKKAAQNIEKYHLEDRITTILSDGLHDIDKNSDCIIIAGMGGHLIKKILEESPTRFKTLILQPNLHEEVVRTSLMELGYQIVDECLIFDRNKYYPIIKAIKTTSKVNYNELELEFGPILSVKKEENFINYYQNKLETFKELLKTLDKDSKGYQDVLKKIEKLNKIL